MSKKGKEKRQQKKEQREKEGKKKIFQKAKDKINSFIKHPQNLIISAGLTPLKPYQPIMKNKLKKMGKPPGNNLAETTKNFVKYVMKKETFEEWQFENFQNASFTPNVEDLEFAEKGGKENVVGAAVGAAVKELIQLIPEIIKTIKDLFKKEPDLDDPENPVPDLPDDIELDQAAQTLLLSHAEEMKQYLAKAGQTYSNDPVENAIKIHQLTYPKKQTFESLEERKEKRRQKREERKEKRRQKREERKEKRQDNKEQSDDLKKFWKNNKNEILSTIAALFVAVGTDPAPDPISQGIGRAVSSTRTAIEDEVKKQRKLKTYTPLLILAAVLLIIVLTKKK